MPRVTVFTMNYSWHIRSPTVDGERNVEEEGHESDEVLEKLECERELSRARGRSA